MQKRAPTLGNLLVIILFVLSCFGLLLFLWESFGGPLPLKAKGYRFTIAFPRTLALAEQSDVRISGVDVGHVISLSVGKSGRTQVTIEIASRYAPLRASTHAMLRQKTLLGETYVQLIPEGGGHSGPFLRDGAQLPNSQIQPEVTLDDLLTAFDPKTRADFRIWQQALAEGINGRGEQINSFFARLEPFVEHTNRLVRILDEQDGAVRALVRNTGVVFDALAGRDHQLEGLITNGEHTFKAAAEGSQGLAQAFRELPKFQKNGTAALKELDRFATVAKPYFEEFQPTERQLSSLLAAAKPFAPEFNRFLTSLGPLTKSARTDLPDLKKSLVLVTPILENFRPVLHNLDPFLQSLGEYLPEVQAFFANITAATAGHGKNGSLLQPNGTLPGPQQHFLQAMPVLSPESLAIYPSSRPGSDRSNPYFQPGIFSSLASGLPVFSSSSCSNPISSVNGPTNETVSAKLIEHIAEFGVANLPTDHSGLFDENRPLTEEEKNEFEHKEFKESGAVTEEEQKELLQEGSTPQQEEKEVKEGALPHREKRRIKKGLEAIEKRQSEHGGNQVAAPGCTQQGPSTFNGKSSQFPHVAYSEPTTPPK